MKLIDLALQINVSEKAKKEFENDKKTLQEIEEENKLMQKLEKVQDILTSDTTIKQKVIDIIDFINSLEFSRRSKVVIPIYNMFYKYIGNDTKKIRKNISYIKILLEKFLETSPNQEFTKVVSEEINSIKRFQQMEVDRKSKSYGNVLGQIGWWGGIVAGGSIGDIIGAIVGGVLGVFLGVFLGNIIANFIVEKTI